MRCVTGDAVRDQLRWETASGGRMDGTSRQTGPPRPAKFPSDDLFAGSEDLVTAAAANRGSSAHGERQPGVRRCAERVRVNVAQIASK